MLVKLRLFAFTISSSLLLLFVLCLGAQNLSEKHNVNLGFQSTAKLPTGFLVGVSIVLSVISGGCTATLFLTSKDQ